MTDYVPFQTEEYEQSRFFSTFVSCENRFMAQVKCFIQKGLQRGVQARRSAQQIIHGN